MLRRTRLERAQTGERYFRWRGGDVSRLEGLTDGVFALSLTLLVVTLEVPKTFAEMRAAFMELPVFLVCFALMVYIWQCHFRIHRRYGLEDPLTIFLDATLLFVVLFYVYPLKFIFRTLYTMLLHGGPWVLDVEGRPLPAPEGSSTAFQLAVSRDDMRILMILYGAGFAGIFTVYAIQTWRAWRFRDALELNAVELVITRFEFRRHVSMVSIGLISIGLSLVSPRFAAASGLVYWAIGPLMWYLGLRQNRSTRAALE
ncbi:MAG: DUF1211 domain-containing protein [Planctomycetes bacterium]|nr:DUF1211 domain-containing protein [Planctomycetota bacterium]